MKYTKKELKKLPLQVLRGLDIKTPEEEAIVQEILDERLGDTPSAPLNIPAHFTDNLTPEKEKELQAKIDAKIDSLRAKKKTKTTANE